MFCDRLVAHHTPAPRPQHTPPTNSEPPPTAQATTAVAVRSAGLVGAVDEAPQRERVYWNEGGTAAGTTEEKAKRERERVYWNERESPQHLEQRTSAASSKQRSANGQRVTRKETDTHMTGAEQSATKAPVRLVAADFRRCAHRPRGEDRRLGRCRCGRRRVGDR